MLPSSSSGLDWMLQSAQVDDRYLAEELSAHFFFELTQFAILALPEVTQAAPWKAREIALQALGRAVYERHRYWGNVSLRAWLFHYIYYRVIRLPAGRGSKASPVSPFGSRSAYDQVAETYPDFRALGREQQAILFLQFGYGFEIGEIAYILDLPAELASVVLNGAADALLPGSLAGETHKTDLGTNEQPEQSDQELEAAGAARREKEALAKTFQEAQSAMNGLDGRLESAAEAGKVLEVARGFSRVKTIRTLALNAGAAGLVVLIAILFIRFTGLLAPPPAPTPEPIYTPTPTLQPTSTPPGFFMFTYLTEEGDTLESLSEKLGIAQETIIAAYPPYANIDWSYSFEMRLPAPEWLLHPGPDPDPLDPVEPLTLDSTLAEVFDRILADEPPFETARLTSQVFSYGPLGYFGPAQDPATYQIWYKRPGWRLWVLKSQDGYDPPVYISENLILTSESREQASFRGSLRDELDYSSQLEMDWIFRIGKGTFEITGLDKVAGREALTLDWQDEAGQYIAHFWIDTYTGLILRSTYAARRAPEIYLYEVITTEALFNIEIPTEVFIPGQGLVNGFVDPEGRPYPEGSELPRYRWLNTARNRLPVKCRLPGEAMDLAASPLLFAWPLPGGNPASLDCSAPVGRRGRNAAEEAPPVVNSGVKVFAGEYYLGKLGGDEMEELQFQSCTRSPDGQKAAISVVDARNNNWIQITYWINLRRPEQLHEVFPGMRNQPVEVFAFSPDSRQIAAVDCSNMCAIFIRDLETGETQTLLTRWTASISHLVWSDDGKQIAYISENWNELRDDPAPEYVLAIIDLEKQGETYQLANPLDAQNRLSLPAGFPRDNWSRLSEDLNDLPDCRYP